MTIRRRRSLLSKIIVGVSVAIFGIEAILLIPTSLLYRQELVQGRRETMAMLARVFIDGPGNRAGWASLAELARELDRHGPELGDEAAYVFDRAGRRVGGSGGDQRDDAAVEIAFGDARGTTDLVGLERVGRLVLVAPIFEEKMAPPTAGDVLSDAPAGYLCLVAPLEPIDGKVANHVLLAMGLVLVILLVTGVTTIYAIYNHVLRPIGSLTAANCALVEGDEERALVPDDETPNDELGDVIRSRNEIYRRTLEYQAAIQEKNEILRRQGLELKRWAIELERRVREKSRALTRAQERMIESEKLVATGRLAAGLAHEINNPLASIAGYAEDLLHQAQQDPSLASHEAFHDFPESLAVIQQQAFRCKNIIRQLLSFARPAPFTIEPVDLANLAESVLPLVEHRARGKDVAIVVDADPTCPPALADRANLTQVLVNLIENAFDALEGVPRPAGPDSKPRSHEITIGIEHLAADGDVVAVQVRDTGCGIPEANVSKIFDPFFTTKPVGSGTGLGLSIVHAIVSRLQGTIEVASEPGRGTVFTITLPAAWSRSGSSSRLKAIAAAGAEAAAAAAVPAGEVAPGGA